MMQANQVRCVVPPVMVLGVERVEGLTVSLSCLSLSTLLVPVLHWQAALPQYNPQLVAKAAQRQAVRTLLLC